MSRDPRSGARSERGAGSAAGPRILQKSGRDRSANLVGTPDPPVGPVQIGAGVCQNRHRSSGRTNQPDRGVPDRPGGVAQKQHIFPENSGRILMISPV